jgi:hypothetical protein
MLFPELAKLTVSPGNVTVSGIRVCNTALLVFHNDDFNAFADHTEKKWAKRLTFTDEQEIR